MPYLGLIDLYSLGGKNSKSPALLRGYWPFYSHRKQSRVAYLNLLNREEKRRERRTKQMEIKVKCSCGEGNCPEWAIIELQGVVEAQPSIRDCIQNLEIGRLCHSSSQVGPFTHPPLFLSSPSVQFLPISFSAVHLNATN